MARKQTKLVRSKRGKLFRRTYLVSEKLADHMFVSGTAHLGAAAGALAGTRYYNRAHNAPAESRIGKNHPGRAPLHYGVFGAAAGYYAAKENKHRLGRRTRFALGIAGHAAGLYTGRKAANEYVGGLMRDYGWVFHLGQK